jgi:tape measure domain-containing protein
MADAQIRITADTSQAERALGGLTGSLKALAGIAFGGSIVKQLYDITVATQEMTNKLIFATGSIDSANKTFGQLAKTAQATGSSLGGTVDLFSKLAQSSTFAGSSNEALAKITENFNKTLQISGASGAGAAAALYQFAQAMQKGTLNGDEFRTIMETNGYLMKVLEKQTGLTRTELISMASDGRLSAEIIGKALVDADMIAQDYGKTVKTLPQAFENLNTALAVAVKNFDSMFGISDTLVKVLDLMAKNIGVVIGVIGGITVAVAALLIPLLPAATAMAVLTGGAAVLGAAALGAAIGYAAQEAGVFGKETDKAVKSQTQLNAEAAKGLKITHQRNQQAIDLDKSLTQTIDQLKAQNVIEAQQTGIKSIGLEVEKAVAKEREKYKKTGEAIPPLLEKELAVETRKKLMIEESLKVKQKILGLESDIYVASIKDAGQRQVTQQLEQYRLSVSEETYKATESTLKLLIEQNIQAGALLDYSRELQSSQIDLNSLGVRDLDLREQTVAIEKERLRLGSLFTSEMEAQVRANIKNAQLLQQQLATEEQRNLLGGIATNQSRAQQIGTATGVIGASDPRLAMAQDYATKKAAIDAAIASEEQKMNAGLQNSYAQLVAAKTNLDIEYRNSKELAEIEFINRDLLRQQAHTDALMALNSKVFEAKKMAELQAQNNSIFGYDTQKSIAKDAADFEKKSAYEKAQFGIQQTASVFAELGKQNKKAFEASKAMNIAMALMNTYMAATKALATYPWPFGLIAAGAAVVSGLAQVAQIRSQSYSGRALGGPVMGGKGYIVGENGPELFTPQGTGSITRNGDLGGGGTTNVNFTIVANDTTGFDQLLASRKGVIQQIISDSMLEKGRRSMV